MKKARMGTMSAEMKEMIEKKLVLLGEVWRYKRPHKKGAGLVPARVLDPEDLVHEKKETVRSGQANRPHVRCSNPKCTELIRGDKWETHVLKMTSDHHLQEQAEDVLQRLCNIAPAADWDTKKSRMDRILTFVEMRHFLALARQHDEIELMQKISDANHFKIRLTNMVRATDPTSAMLFKHYKEHYLPGDADSLADLLINIVWLRNTMSKQVVKMVEKGKMPWLRVKAGRLDPDSQRAADTVFLQLGGKVFFEAVQPMKTRSKAPRHGYGELVSEIVSFARKAAQLADLWRSENAVEKVANEIRTISGFGGKGFRMKEIVLDAAEITSSEYPTITDQLVDWSVVGPGPRRTLNWLNNRRWLDNEQESFRVEATYVEELREFKAFLQKTEIEELRSLNLLGVQFALCEASKYIFYLETEHGTIYRPSTRDFELFLNEVPKADMNRLKAIWLYWEDDRCEDLPAEEDQPHPDMFVV